VIFKINVEYLGNKMQRICDKEPSIEWIRKEWLESFGYPLPVDYDKKYKKGLTLDIGALIDEYNRRR